MGICGIGVYFGHRMADTGANVTFIAQAITSRQCAKTAYVSTTAIWANPPVTYPPA